MLDGEFAGTGPVRSGLQWRVLINGTEYPIVSDPTIDAQIASDLPEQVSGVSGFRQRQGTLSVGRPGASVSEILPSPVVVDGGNWPPKTGDSIELFQITDEGVQFRRATGVIDDVGANLGEPSVDLSWVDGITEELATPTTLPPVASVMPGEEDLSSGTSVKQPFRTAIQPWGVVVEALEDAGRRLLPSLGTVALYALIQGNLNPRVGTIGQTYSAGNLLEWDTVSGFQYLSQWSYFGAGFVERPPNACFTVYLRKTRGGPDAQTRWTMEDGAEIRVTLQNGSAAVSRNGVVLAQQGFTATSNLPWLGVSIAYESIVLWYEGGMRTVDISANPVSSLVWTRVRALGVAAMAATYELRAGWPGFSWPSLRFRNWGEGLVRSMNSSRTIEAEKVSAVLAEIAKATLSGFWLDEFGILQWAPSNVLESQEPVAEISTTWDVLKGSWTENRGGAASSVVVKYEDAVVQVSNVVGVDVKPGQTGKMLRASDPPDSVWVEPEPEEEWIEPDMSPLRGDQSADIIYKRGLYSIYGGSFISGDSQDEDAVKYGWAQSPDYGFLSIDVSPVSPRLWKVTHNVSGTSREINLVTLPGNGTNVPIPWRSQPLPWWRARGKVTFSSTTLTRTAGGPAWASSYEHDLSHWGTRADAMRVGDWLAARMSSSQFVLSELEVSPNPKYQQGDVIIVNAQGALRAALRCLIIGIHQRGSTMKLDLRVIRVTGVEDITYAILEAESTYAAIEDGTSYVPVEQGEV